MSLIRFGLPDPVGVLQRRILRHCEERASGVVEHPGLWSPCTYCVRLSGYMYVDREGKPCYDPRYAANNRTLRECVCLLAWRVAMKAWQDAQSGPSNGFLAEGSQ